MKLFIKSVLIQVNISHWINASEFSIEYVASNIFKQILLAIQYMYLNGVCHRDLKPNNILVSEGMNSVELCV